jgi:hypothetical protein
MTMQRAGQASAKTSSGASCLSAFVNFLVVGDWNPERTRASYSPEDWERLVELKDRYDPNNLFRFNRNIPPSSVLE